MFFVFQLIMIIVMFNVLIAIVSDVYNDVKETAVVEVRKLRAKMIIETQSVMSSSEKNDVDEFPPYLEVLRAKEEPEVVWSGVSGQISRLESVVNQRDKRMAAKVAAVEESVAKVDGKVDALDEKMAELKAMLTDLASDKAQ